MRPVIRRFDAFLSRRLRIFQFCSAPDCILRMQITRAPHAVQLAGGSIQAGEPVLAFHLWNEHLPKMSYEGPDLDWAKPFGRRLVGSFHAAAIHVREQPVLAQRKGLYGATALFPPTGSSGGARLMRRLGFTILPYHSRLGDFGEFWENFYSWWVLWAYAPASLRTRRFMVSKRSEMWMLMEDFLRLYGN